MDQIFLRLLIQVIIASIFIGRGARRHGYSGTLWAFVALLSWPMFTLMLLSGLPDRRIARRRQEERDLLERQLSKRRTMQRSAREMLTDATSTINDAQTIR